MSHISEKDLSQGNLEFWYAWLREGLIAYTSDDSVPQRYKAFSPLLVDPQSGNPASDLVKQLRTVKLERSGVIDGAVIEVLRYWSLPADGWRPATLLISVAARLGGRGVAQAIRDLIARSGDLPEDVRGELAYVALEAAKIRYKYSEIFSLVELLWTEKLGTPRLVAKIALLMSRVDLGGLRMMPVNLVKMMPTLVQPPNSGDYVRAIATALRNEYGVEDLTVGLLPIKDEAPNIAELRGVMLRLAAPKVDLKPHETSNLYIFPVPQHAQDRMHDRLAGLDEFADKGDVSSLPFPPKSSAGADGSERS
jgi:hypothetical protein